VNVYLQNGIKDRVMNWEKGKGKTLEHERTKIKVEQSSLRCFPSSGTNSILNANAEVLYMPLLKLFLPLLITTLFSINRFQFFWSTTSFQLEEDETENHRVGFWIGPANGLITGLTTYSNYRPAMVKELHSSFFFSLSNSSECL